MTINTDPGPSFPGTGVTADDGASTGTAGGDRLRTTASGSTVGHDRIRWDAVWAGALTTLATYLTLELLFFALGGLDLGADAGGGTTEAAVSGVLALVAFFLGGAATGGSAPWHRADDGMVNGVVAWAPSRRRRPSWRSVDAPTANATRRRAQENGGEERA